MKKILLLSALSMFIIIGCSDDPATPENILGCTDIEANNYNESATEDDGSCDYSTEFDVLKTHMSESGYELSNILDAWVKPASHFMTEVNGENTADGYYVLDLRAEDAFNSGHIKDANNIAFADIITATADVTETVMVVCYTGQTAARATTLLRLSGKNAISLKWGMSGWNEAFAEKWDSNAADGTDIPATWLYTDDDWVTATEHDYPPLATGYDTGSNILNDRIEYVLGLDWKGKSFDSGNGVAEAPENYFINNYWTETSYNEYGHFDGVYRVKEDLNLDGLKYLESDVNQTMITYCYTGQTSAAITAWLQVMGYDNARSLLFGANGIIGSTIPAKSWRGDDSGSENGYGYYDATGEYVAP